MVPGTCAARDAGQHRAGTGRERAAALRHARQGPGLLERIDGHLTERRGAERGLSGREHVVDRRAAHAVDHPHVQRHPAGPHRRDEGERPARHFPPHPEQPGAAVALELRRLGHPLRTDVRRDVSHHLVEAGAGAGRVQRLGEVVREHAEHLLVLPQRQLHRHIRRRRCRDEGVAGVVDDVDGGGRSAGRDVAQGAAGPGDRRDLRAPGRGAGEAAVDDEGHVRGAERLEPVPDLVVDHELGGIVDVHRVPRHQRLVERITGGDQRFVAVQVLREGAVPRVEDDDDVGGVRRLLRQPLEAVGDPLPRGLRVQQHADAAVAVEAVAPQAGLDARHVVRWAVQVALSRRAVRLEVLVVADADQQRQPAWGAWWVVHRRREGPGQGDDKQQDGETGVGTSSQY